MVAFAAGSSEAARNPFGFALTKCEPDFQCRISCTENPCRLGGLGGHDGLVIGHDGPPAILASTIVYLMAISYAIDEATMAGGQPRPTPKPSWPPRPPRRHGFSEQEILQ